MFFTYGDLPPTKPKRNSTFMFIELNMIMFHKRYFTQKRNFRQNEVIPNLYDVFASVEY